jgi:TDG/mug DNA glycosylase family protein
MQLSYFDILEPCLPIVFCGINPSKTAATTGHNFGSASNRFWTVLHQAGFTPIQLAAKDDRQILKFGCGITAAVSRPTRRADELTPHELRDAGTLLHRKIAFFRPGVIAFLGKAAFAALHDGGTCSWGRQPTMFAQAETWILPNPSGLNRSFSVAELISAYAELRIVKADELSRWRY